MAVTYDEAYTQITERFLDRWNALSPAIVGTVDAPEVRFQDIEKKTAPSVTFARFVMNPVSSPQATLRNGEHGQRYESNGIIIVQLLVLRDDEGAESKARRLAEIAQGIFRDPTFPGCYIFQNTRINNLLAEPLFLRKNVVTEYQFDELT